MARKIHRTARGATIDMERLRLANEDTIAVGNMKVNARGDELGFGGSIVKTRKEVIDATYKVHTMVPQDDRVYTDAMHSEAAMAEPAPVVSAEPKPKVEEVATPTEESKTMRGGLAAALAKKVEVTEPEIKLNSLSTGVKRI
jgi:hypothetical protein